jgi:hypothetical protein
MSGTGWGITLGIIYLVLLVVFAVLSFRKGHWVLGLIGFIFPLLWIIGAILPSRYAAADPVADDSPRLPQRAAAARCSVRTHVG